MKNVFVSLALLGLLVLPSMATAQDDVDEGPSVDEPDEEVLPKTELVQVSNLKLPWTEPTGVGVGIGLDNGAWGRFWQGGLKIKLPFGTGKFGQHFGCNLRGMALVADNREKEDEALFVTGGRFEIYGQSEVLLNIIRLYGGGGVQYLYNVSDSKGAGFGGGGYAGFEFFTMRAISFYIEIGGNSGLDTGEDSHATVVAGMNLYPVSI